MVSGSVLDTDWYLPVSHSNTVYIIQQSGALSLVQISIDTVLSLVEPYYAGAKVYAMTTHAFYANWCVVMA